MTLYKNRYRIESTRLQNWDYSNPGRYFLTVCVKDRLNILGHIDNGKMVLNKNGEILNTWLLKIDTRYDNATLDKWVIMPNHWHCIIHIIENDGNGVGNGVGNGNGNGNGNVETIHESSLRGDGDIKYRDDRNESSGQKHDNTPCKYVHRNKRRKMLLSKIIGYVKMNSSKHINLNLNQSGTNLWQKGFWDRIIRDRKEYYRITNYIKNNPMNWKDDKLFISL